MTSAVPVVTDIAYQDLLDDPYPIFRRLREIAPAVFVAPAKLTLVTRFDDIMRIERDPATYSADNPASLVNKVMGPTFMRKDGAEHAIGRITLLTSEAGLSAARRSSPRSARRRSRSIGRRNSPRSQKG